jgi:ribosomal protein L24E
MVKKCGFCGKELRKGDAKYLIKEDAGILKLGGIPANKKLIAGCTHGCYRCYKIFLDEV